MVITYLIFLCSFHQHQPNTWHRLYGLIANKIWRRSFNHCLKKQNTALWYLFHYYPAVRKEWAINKLLIWHLLFQQFQVIDQVYRPRPSSSPTIPRSYSFFSCISISWPLWGALVRIKSFFIQSIFSGLTSRPHWRLHRGSALRL